VGVGHFFDGGNKLLVVVDGDDLSFLLKNREIASGLSITMIGNAVKGFSHNREGSGYLLLFSKQ
jgi:hypothetical protein